MSLNRQLDRLYTLRDQLELKLDMHDARRCFGNDEAEDGTLYDLRDRITEIAEQIANLERGSPFLIF